MNYRFLRIISYVLLLLVCNRETVSAQLLSFPGAEGAGKYVTGGRGNVTTSPKIFEVTSLVDNATAASTPGTLRYAVTNNSPSAPNRIIVFRVSGTIHLYTTLSLNRANTTIAGQTAPGGGITIADYPVYIGANNIVLRYIRFRLGDKNQPASLGNDDAFGDNGGAKQKVIVDHCSMSWSNDEVCSMYEGDSITIQWCLMSEPLDSSYHDEGSGVQQHAYGGIQGGKRASIHHNLYAHCRGRMPRFNGIRNGVADTTDFRNNVIYNWADYNTNGGEGGTYNVVNNYYKFGPNTPNTTTSGVSRRNMLIQPYKQTSPAIPYGRYYLTGNYCFNSPSVTARNWLGASFSGGSLTDSTASKVTTPFNCVAINVQNAADAFQSVLVKAGTTLPYRDTLDERIVSNVINSTGKLINCQGGYPRGTSYAVTQNAWPFLPAGYTPTDTDHDGMPDVWENQRGLNASSSTDLNQYLSTTGYSNVETYLNGDTITAPGTLNACVQARTVSSTASGSWIHLKDTSYGDYNSAKYLVSTDTNNLIISVYDDVNYGSLNASYYTTGTTRNDASGKPYLNRNITLVSSSATALTAPVSIRMYISKKEYDDLRAVDNTILSLSDLRIVRSDASSCNSSLPLTYTVYQPTASGVFGSYRNGYYIDFQTTAFGTFYITGYNTILPLTLMSFKAIAKENQVLTQWTTAQEINLNNFYIEKSKNAIDFSVVGIKIAQNSSGINQYQFTDFDPYLGTSFYRLRAYDRDGKFSSSKIVPVYFGDNNSLNLYPNPASGILHVNHKAAGKSCRLFVTDATGRVCLKKEVLPGSVNTILDLKTILPGTYILELHDGKDVFRKSFNRINE